MHESIQAGLELRARHSAVGNGRNWYCRFRCHPGSQPLQSVGTSRNIRSVTEVSRRGGVLRNVGTEFKLMQELLRHSSLRSTLDIYTQAINASQARGSKGCVVAGIFARGKSVLAARGTHLGRILKKDSEGKGTRRRAGRRMQSGHENVSFYPPRRGFVVIDASSLERMAWTTRLELATSAATAARL